MNIPKWPRTDKMGEKYILDVLASNQWGATGIRWRKKSYETKFTNKFASYNNSPYCLTTLNGSTAIELALLALGIRKGDKVLVTALTWVSCATAILSVGAIPIFIDIDKSNLCMDIAKTKYALKKYKKCKAILLVHAYCSIAPIEEFIKLTKKYKVHLIEDCSQSHGAKYKNQLCGSFGVCGIFSMQSSKVLSSGEGGAIIFQKQKYYTKAQKLRLDGRVPSNFPIGQTLVKTYNPISGRNRTITEFQHALLLRGLELLDSENSIRTKNASYLGDILSQYNISYFFQKSKKVLPSFYRFIYFFDKEKMYGNDIDEHIEYLVKNGIPAERVHIPIPLNRAIPKNLQKNKKFVKDNFPISLEIYNSCVTLAHQCLLMDGVNITELSKYIIEDKVDNFE